MQTKYYRSFIKDNSVVIGGHILVYMKSLIIMPIIVKTVGVTIYGGFVLLASLFGVAFGISSFGAGFRAKRFMPSAKTMSERRELFYPQFYFNLLIILILSVMFVLLRDPLNRVIFKHDIVFSIWIVPLYLTCYLLFSQGSDYFRYTSRVHYMTITALCFPYLHICFVLLYLYIFGSINIDMLVISMSLSALLVALPSFRVIIREIGVSFVWYKAANLIADIKLGFPLVLGLILDFILAGSDRYLIAFYMSLADVGYYVPGYVLGSLIAFLPRAMGTAVPQLISKAVDTNNEGEAHEMLNYAIKIFLLAAIPFIFATAALAKPILTLLANAEVAHRSQWVTPIVALGTAFYGLNIILSSILFVRMRTFAILKMNLSAAIFNLLTNAILLLVLTNIIVAAITTFLSYLIAFVYITIQVRIVWPVSFQPLVIFKSIVASLLMASMLFWAPFNTGGATTAIILAGKVLFGFATYILCLFLLRTFTTTELRFMKAVLLNDALIRPN